MAPPTEAGDLILLGPGVSGERVLGLLEEDPVDPKCCRGFNLRSGDVTGTLTGIACGIPAANTIGGCWATEGGRGCCCWVMWWIGFY